MRNLVVIVADTLRRLASIRQLDPNRDAPFLSRIERTSVAFDRVVASSPWSVPSHLSLLYGSNPWQLGPDYRLSPSWRQMSLARRWSEAGGVCLSLSHNEMISAHSGVLFGYDDSFSSPLFTAQHTAFRLSSILDLALGITSRKLGATVPLQSVHGKSLRCALPRMCHTALAKAARTSSRALHVARTSRAGLSRLTNLIDSVRGSKPIHIFINLMDVHEPYVRARSVRETALNVSHFPTSNLAIHSRNLQASGAKLGPFHEAYLQAIRSLDQSLQGVFEVLEKSGVLDDALVCILSDHGQSLGENGFFGHGWMLSDELVRIPAYLWFSRHGRGTPAVTRITDWLDHRHLHDILLDQLSQPENSVASSVFDALARRGPAISYFWGRPLSGFNPRARLPSYERIRVWQDDSQVEVHKGGGSPGARLISAQGHKVSDLQIVADHVFRETNVLSGQLNSVEALSEASNRLEGWGYT